MTVYALDYNLLSVNIVNISFYFNTLEAYSYLFFDRAVRALIELDGQSIKLGCFRTPFAAFFDNAVYFKLAAYLASENLLFVKVNTACNFPVRAEFNFQVKYAVNVAVINCCSCIDILNRGFGLGNKVDLTVYSGELPHILVFKIGCVTEAHKLCGKSVFALMKNIGYIKLGRGHRALRITDIFAVDIDIKRRLCRAEMQNDPPAVKVFGQSEAAAIETYLVLFVAYFRNLRFGSRYLRRH